MKMFRIALSTLILASMFFFVGCSDTKIEDNKKVIETEKQNKKQHEEDSKEADNDSKSLSKLAE